ncbi:MAG: carboxypeptidase-like regulatory domain-containing protein, partial [Bryobacteraceae bacterium]
MRLARVCFALLLATVVSVAQIGTSTIVGRITDPTSAVVANVQVTVVDIARNFTYSTVTNQEGLYRVQSLPPGLFRVTLEAQGFKRFVRDNIDLRTGDTLAVDGVLQVGSVSESVEVSGAAQLL